MSTESLQAKGFSCMGCAGSIGILPQPDLAALRHTPSCSVLENSLVAAFLAMTDVICSY